MNEYQVIDHSRIILLTAESYMNNDNRKGYCQAMSALLDFLMTNLVGGASNETQTKIDNISP